MVEIFNNKQAFLKTKPRNLSLILLIILFCCLILLIYLTFTKIYDNYPTTGFISCNDTCVLTTYLPSTITYDYLTINNKKKNYEILSQDIVIPEDTLISLKKIIYQVNNDYLDNEIVNLNFYYNKQRIINKILTKVF